MQLHVSDLNVSYDMLEEKKDTPIHAYVQENSDDLENSRNQTLAW